MQRIVLEIREHDMRYDLDVNEDEEYRNISAARLQDIVKLRVADAIREAGE